MSIKNKNTGINRRNFVKKGAAAGAALLVAPMIMRKARANDSNDINIALLGAGSHVLFRHRTKPGQALVAHLDIFPREPAG